MNEETDFTTGAPTNNLTGGNFNVQDTATATTPISIPGTGTFTQLTNNGLGSLTTNANAPAGMTELWDTTDHEFDFTQLKMGDRIDFRVDLLVDILTVNTDIELQLEAGIGVFAFGLNLTQRPYKTTGVKPVTIVTFVTMDTITILTGTAELQLKADKACEVEVIGWNYVIIRRS